MASLRDLSCPRDLLQGLVAGTSPLVCNLNLIKFNQISDLIFKFKNTAQAEVGLKLSPKLPKNKPPIINKLKITMNTRHGRDLEQADSTSILPINYFH